MISMANTLRSSRLRPSSNRFWTVSGPCRAWPKKARVSREESDKQARAVSAIADGWVFQHSILYVRSMNIGAEGRSMSVVRKTITLTEQQNDWVKMRIGSGDYTNDSEYIRDLIRRDQEHSAGLEQLRMLLDEGEHSGVSQRSPRDILSAARERLKADGEL